MTVLLKDILGENFDDEFMNFDLTEVQNILSELQDTNAIDLAHAEMLQQQALRCADILSEYLSRVVKVVSYLESKLNSVKNKAALNYKPEDGARVTADMRKFASEIAPEVEAVSAAIAKARGSKVLLEKKYDILIKSHHHYKEISSGIRQTLYSSSNTPTKKDEWS